MVRSTELTLSYKPLIHLQVLKYAHILLFKMIFLDQLFYVLTALCGQYWL